MENSSTKKVGGTKNIIFKIGDFLNADHEYVHKNKSIKLTRVEAQKFIVGYEFDLTTNDLSAKTTPNPSAGKVHTFIACRVKNEPGTPVSMSFQETSS